MDSIRELIKTCDKSGVVHLFIRKEVANVIIGKINLSDSGYAVLDEKEKPVYISEKGIYKVTLHIAKSYEHFTAWYNS